MIATAFLSACALLLSLSVQISGQTAAKAKPEDTTAIKLRARLVNLNIRVASDSGKAVPKLTPEIMTGMGSSPVIGYGKYHYKSPSGREGDWFLIGLTAGKNYYSLHICSGDKSGYLVEQNAAKLGKVKTGRSCINFKKLEDLKLEAAMALVKQAVKSGGINADR